MICFKPGRRSRLTCAIREYRGRKKEPKGFGWRDFRDLIVRARIQLGGPIVLGWGQRPPPPDGRHEAIHRSERRMADRVATPGLRS